MRDQPFYCQKYEVQLLLPHRSAEAERQAWTGLEGVLFVPAAARLTDIDDRL